MKSLWVFFWLWNLKVFLFLDLFRFIFLCFFLEPFLIAGILKCNYVREPSDCELRNVTLPSTHQDVLDIANRTKDSIMTVEIWDSKVDFIPNLLNIGLPKLRKISLSRTETPTELKSNFFRPLFNDVRYFELDGYSVPIDEKVKTFGDRVFAKLPNLVKIKIYNEGILELGENVFSNNSNLSYIVMSANRFIHLDEGVFSSLVDLKTVDFSTNLIEDLNEHIFRNNLLLESINFQNNLLKSLPGKLFFGLEELEELHFGSNQLRSLDPELFQTNLKLTSINFEHNFLTNIPADSFKGLLNLEEVNFHSNFIEALDENLFRDNSNITKLYFMENRIQKLHKNLFSSLVDLELLRFDNNMIETLTSKLFASNGMLAYIRLNDNRISKIEPSNLDSFLKARETDLRGNECSNDHFSTWAFDKRPIKYLMKMHLRKCFDGWTEHTKNSLEHGEDLMIHCWILF